MPICYKDHFLTQGIHFLMLLNQYYIISKSRNHLALLGIIKCNRRMLILFFYPLWVVSCDPHYIYICIHFTPDII